MMELENIDRNLNHKSQEAFLLKLNNKNAKKILNNYYKPLILNINKPNSKRALDRYSIKERLRLKLEEKKLNAKNV